MRTFLIVIAVITLLVGVVFVVSPLVRGLGLTVGALLGLLMIAVGGARLYRELTR